MTEALRAEREILASEAYNTYDPDNFPGSRAYMANMAAERALAAFDSEHPEIAATIEAEKAAEAKQRSGYFATPEGIEKMYSI